GIAGRKVVTLITTHHGFGYFAAQEGVFSAAFCNPSPTGIATQINHGGESPANAVGTGFDGGYARALLNKVHIPGTGKTQWNGKNRFITMNHIHPEYQGDLQPAFFNGHLLYTPDFINRSDIEQSAYFSFPDF